ncbi:SUKH-3 domain-containing protein [Roseiconus lacunae]|uniref:SUKH-3 domain-containing protein n=1 Tax=Roseiconus lacunae TaxID=2605694 RepID=UPI0011F18998|nr:SUKH-3 domain-containing protein [Roseiconus lacunae]
MIRYLRERADLATLIESGWRPNRRISLDSSVLPDGFELTVAATRFLTEYGGLTIKGRVQVDLTPMACREDHDRIAYFSTLDNRQYFPVGRIDDECATDVLVDEVGDVYLYCAPPTTEEGPWRIGGPSRASVLRLLT